MKVPSDPWQQRRSRALVIGLTAGALGFLGMGHFYLGDTRRGAAFFMAGLAVGAAFWTSAVFCAMAVFRVYEALLAQRVPASSDVKTMALLALPLLPLGSLQLGLLVWQSTDILTRKAHSGP